ncbi:MAG TPA: tyrosine-protein phosphatase [Sphingobium sp.]|uniref:tyrosine-protein phosphatase n=1 Tax=Sphingobium sp. TaxID=1912891 RepID=UPI002ED05581
MNLFKISGLGAIAALALLAQPVLLPRAVAEAPAAQPAHERLLPLQGGRNFRDLGGYRTADGHSVKWGLLFRSGEMHDLTAQDYGYLNKIGIRTVCDFRDRTERKTEPTEWQGKAPTIFFDDYDMQEAALMPTGDMKSWTPEQARQVMAASYPKMLTTFAGQYRRMFQELLAGRAPLAFHCSAGKDRTGIAAALILTSLGVPRETVVQDYLLTNRYLNVDAAMKSANSPAAQQWLSLPAPVLQAFGKADPSYIDAVLNALDAHAGGARGYLHDVMGLSDADIAKLRTLYLD